MKIINNNADEGFTLVELLVSIAVLVSIGAIVMGAITSSLRGSNKTNFVENIRQNGNYALSQMSKNIEYAQVFNGLSTDGAAYTTSCVVPPAIPYKYIKVTPLNGNTIEYECAMPSPPSTDAPTFTINDTVTEYPIVSINTVKIKECSISCTQTGIADAPIIGISFTLEPVTATPALVENSSPPIKFETSVTLRNYRR